MKIPTSIQNTKHAVRSVLITVCCILFIFILIEAGLRLLVKNNVIPKPGIGSIHPELNVKLLKLDQFVKQNGGVDCIFLGSSMIDDSVNPSIFTKEYRKLSGRNVHCFNLSIASLTAETAYPIVKMLNVRYNPLLIVYGISPRDLTSDFDVRIRPLIHEPWINYQNGEFSISGWLKENSYTYRYYVTVLSYLNPDNRASLQIYQTSVNEDGFNLVDRNTIGIGGQNYIKKWKTNLDDMHGLKKMLLMGKGDSFRIILAEAPVHDLFLPIYVEGSKEKYFSLFQKPIEELTKQYNTIFIKSVSGAPSFIPNKFWGDVKHLNYKGADVFSRWLANQIWQQIDSGTIEDPFRP